MSPTHVFFDADGHAVSPAVISKSIAGFGNSYNEVVKEIISASVVLDDDIFIKCASRVLSNFKMTRRGVFQRNVEDTLRNCWRAVGTDLTAINNAVQQSGLSRDRYLLELSEREREALIANIWRITKKLLPFTMGGTSYGLVGASKILFSVLPEIVLPVDNAEWVHVFQTVDLGDVLRSMVGDIVKWEGITGSQLNTLDESKRLTTLPAVYNVMAMYARPRSYGSAADA